MEHGTLHWAEAAVHWAKQPYPAIPGRSNYAQLLEQVCATIANDPGKVRLMRNQASMGMNNNYWPTLSRLMIMDEPELVRWIKPSYNEQLDCQAGIAMMQIYFGSITNRRAKVRSWKHAKEVICR